MQGCGFADYLLYVGGKATGVIEAKPAGSTLTGAEPQTERCARGVSESVPAAYRPLPFLYQSPGGAASSMIAPDVVWRPPLPEPQRVVAEIEKHLTRLDAAIAPLERPRPTSSAAAHRCSRPPASAASSRPRRTSPAPAAAR